MGKKWLENLDVMQMQLDSSRWMTLLAALRRIEQRLDQVETSMRELAINGISVALHMEDDSGEEGEGEDSEAEPTGHDSGGAISHAGLYTPL